MRPTLLDLTGKPHLSYSGFDTFMQCGEKYRLQRIHRVESDGAWWFVGGSAIHEATELYDRGHNTDLALVWQTSWDKALSGVDTSKPMRAAGRESKQWPNKEDGEWWKANGFTMLEDYAKWRDVTGWQVLTINDAPAIEYGFTLVLPNPSEAADASPSLIVEGFIDRVFVNRDGEAIVLDLKSGSREPVSTTQLGMYKVALHMNARVDIGLGCYYMTRKGTHGETRSLHHYTPELIAFWLSSMEDSVRSGRLLPHVTSMCGTCDVAKHCYAVGGTPPYTPLFLNNK